MELRIWAFHLGRTLLIDKATEWKHRVETWWSAWKEEKELAHALGQQSREVHAGR
jgi:hypothetical protein